MSVFDRLVNSQSQSENGQTTLKRSGTMDRTIMDAYNWLSVSNSK